ncbi:energy transducer TonB family protein [Yoonia maritima]|uniref:energy transducer TonB family protein n=1 Tax=Yoonia maritima TaxID=1435347 RepID=UPI000D109481|nr:energy transducer TonB [Yoonia maritima]
MIAQSHSIKVVALVAAMALHVAVFWRPAAAPPPILIAAAGASVEAKMGSSFADMAVGVMTPTVAAPAPVAPTTPAPVMPATMTGVNPVVAAQVEPAPAPEAPEVVEPTVAPVVPPTPPVTPVEPVEAEAIDNSPTTSIRPTARPRNLAQRTTPVQERGNANQQATAGSNNRQTASTQVSSGSQASSGDSAPVSNAAVTNYPGQVMRRISRVRRPRTSERGAAMVAFSIGANGSLASAQIARSSGSAALDQMALQILQRASPFPAPPAGARTRFQVEITTR